MMINGFKLKENGFKINLYFLDNKVGFQHTVFVKPILVNFKSGVSCGASVRQGIKIFQASFETCSNFLAAHVTFLNA